MNPTNVALNKVDSELEHVTINKDSLEQFVSENTDTDFELPSWDAPVFPEVNEEFTKSDVVDFLVVGNSLNFCFNDPETGDKFEATRNGMTFDGAFAMWLCLYTEQTSGELDMLDPETLVNFDVADFERVFEPSNNTSMPLIEERVSHLNDLGYGMKELDGSFGNLVQDQVVLFDNGDGFVEQLIQLSGEAYTDSRTYQDTDIPFNKRAQLATMMIYGFFQDSEFFTVSDPTEFTIPSDYGVPNTLRSLDIIQYDEELSELVDSETELDENSQFEVEIRIATVRAGNMIMDSFNNNLNETVAIPKIDYFLWSLRRETENPEHLTVTTAY